jgi:nicotinate-nucleotide adenylyltransferase
VRRRRLAIFGGTFDPPHHGHLLVASDAFEALRVDVLLFVPAADPPHKRGAVVASGEQRHAMLRACIENDRRFAIDDLELRRGGASYTVDTLRELHAREPNADLVFLLGVDQFKAFENWREPNEVASLAQLAVLARGGETVPSGGAYRHVQVPVRRIDISATEVRTRIATGRSIRYLVPEAVEKYILAEKLYR